MDKRGHSRAAKDTVQANRILFNLNFLPILEKRATQGNKKLPS